MDQDTMSPEKRASFARRSASLVERRYLIATEKCGDINVIVQGVIDNHAIFFTVHDLGCNHSSLQEFVNNKSMAEIRERSCFVHIDVPGHSNDDNILADSFPFPSLQTLGSELITVLDFLHVKYVIGLGDGAGANVLARFAIAHPTRVLGLILVNPSGSGVSILQSVRNKFINWNDNELTSSAASYLRHHKFGHSTIFGENRNKQKIVEEYVERLQSQMVSKNVGLYAKAFMNRKTLSLKECQVDCILITGMLNPSASMMHILHRDMEKKKWTMLKIRGAAHVLAEAPGKVAQSILLFCQGQGLLTSIRLTGMDHAQSTSNGSSASLAVASHGAVPRPISMEDYDKPNLLRHSGNPIMPKVINFNSVYMDAPRPKKPPRDVKYGKDETTFFKPTLKSLYDD